MRLLTLLLALLVLTGCATRERYEQRVQTYIGKPISVVMDEWGYPSGSFESPTGNTVYVWETESRSASPHMSVGVYGGRWMSVGTHVGMGMSSAGTVSRCQTFFEVNKQKIITHWRLQGDCRQ